MKCLCMIGPLALTLAAATHTMAADAETLTKLDETLKVVPTFVHGGQSGPLVEAEKIVFQLATDAPSRVVIEQKLLDTLAVTRTNEGKAFLCTLLRVVGTERCVPALEELLTDPKVSHMAVYALGRLEVVEASEALRRAVTKTTGDIQTGIIHALRARDARGDTLQGQEIRPGPGHVGAANVVRVEDLDTLSDKVFTLTVPKEKHLRVMDAMLHLAEKAAIAGDMEKAAGIYRDMYGETQPIQFRCAALRGLVLTGGDEALPLLLKAFDDDQLRRTAISYVPLATGKKATLAFADRVGALEGEDRVLLLRALGDRGDAAAAGILRRETTNTNEAIRIAAIEALGKAGDVTIVEHLLRTIAKTGNVDTAGIEKKFGRASLAMLDAEGVDTALAKAIGEGDTGMRIEAIAALAARRATSAQALLLETAMNEETTVRHAAIAALGRLANEEGAAALIGLVLTPKQPSDRAVLEDAIGKIATRLTSSEAKADCPVMVALPKAPVEAKPTLIRLLAKMGQNGGLDAVRRALKDREPMIVDAAVEAMAQWPDAAAANDLLALISTTSNDEHKTLALQGFVRLAAIAEDATALYVEALRKVDRVADKKLVLAALGQSSASNSVEVLALPQEFLDDEALGPTAGLATLRIANRLKDRDGNEARKALEKVIATVDHDDVRQRAQEVINDMEKYDDHIVDWVGVGPFRKEGANGEAVYGIAFGPEHGDGVGIGWKALTKGISNWSVDVEANFGGFDHFAVYVRTRVWSPVEQNAQLEMGSDDAAKAWLNGRIVWDKWGGGGTTPRQKRAAVKLAKGWNTLMLKIVDNEGGCGFCCRLRKPDGTALGGLKIEAE